ncbi:FecR family protein [Pedobacter faecalis]|uniref:FecR family protein n=1 Tax=Pedobacter faecalis TaxID=3041495 RepID=UPI002551171E|nr:FecR family protein [Pedobacter sp. ELA7]
MDNKRAKELIESYKAGTATPEELGVIEKWIMLGTVRDMDLSEVELQAELNIIRSRLPLSTVIAVGNETDNALSSAAGNAPAQEAGAAGANIKLWPKFTIAASIAAAVATIVFGIWFFNYRGDRNAGDAKDISNYANDIAPGQYGATITLANGKTIVLDSAKAGVVIGQALTYNDGTEVPSSGIGEPSSRTEGRDLLNGKGKRSPDGSGQVLGSLEMTASTARGQTYQITLPDGTRVWLNAASKIEFPASFAGLVKREVRLSGEAYFEVFRNKKQPFVVTSKNLSTGSEQQVEVLGTHFNINTYTEVIATTLLEGSVRVNDMVMLKPNEQLLQKTDGSIDILEADATKVLAWKAGDFRFSDDSITEVMDQLARWYNIEVLYKGPKPTERFTAAISRNKNISQILNVLAKTKAVRFEINGKTVTVTK